MSVEGRMDSLRQKHQDLHRRIESLEASPAADDLEIAALKKQKLALKDEMTTMRN